MHEVIMPKLGLDMETGTIEKWHKKQGDAVKSGEILLEVMTDKVSLEVEAYSSGTLLKIVHEEGEEVPVTEVIAYIGNPGEKIPDVKNVIRPGTAGPAGADNEKIIRAETIPDKDPSVIKISPIARRIAKERGIDISGITGTGPGGRIIREDVEKELDRAGVPETDKRPREKSRKILSGVRKIIAERLSYSAQTIPQVMLNIVADAKPVIDVKEKLKVDTEKQTGIPVTVTDIIIKAAAKVLREQPRINASLVEGEHILFQDINIGIAVAAEEGLVVPTVYQADTLSLQEVAGRRLDLVTRAGSAALTAEDVSNGTFTISNLGMYGIRNFTAIINPPQAAILMVGEIYKTPVIAEDKLEVGASMQIGLTIDHRILDGADAARFLARLKEVLQEPEGLL